MKRIAIVVSLLLPFLLAVSCEKEKNGNAVAGPAQLGVEVKDAEDVIDLPKSRSQAFELCVVAKPGSAEAYTITLSANPGLVDAYNTAHGTSYEMLPSEAYSITSTTVTLPRFTAHLLCGVPVSPHPPTLVPAGFMDPAIWAGVECVLLVSVCISLLPDCVRPYLSWLPFLHVPCLQQWPPGHVPPHLLPSCGLQTEWGCSIGPSSP